MKPFYQVLEIAPSALADEIKRAFRLQIARYHPDKVQHLGKEFQEMAAERAAQLTEAYRILSDEQLRAEYDRRLTSDGIEAPSAAAPRASGAGFTTVAAPQAPVHEPDAGTASANAGRFADERAMRDR